VRPNNQKEAGFEILTAAVMESSIFCDITPCISLELNRLFGGHAYSSNLKIEAPCSSETYADFNGSHGDISQNTEHFTTSNKAFIHYCVQNISPSTNINPVHRFLPYFSWYLSSNS
jgi:hypothetical protein